MSDGYARAIQVVREDAIQQVEEWRKMWQSSDSASYSHGYDYDVRAWTGEDTEGDRVLSALIKHMKEWAGIQDG